MLAKIFLLACQNYTECPKEQYKGKPFSKEKTSFSKKKSELILFLVLSGKVCQSCQNCNLRSLESFRGKHSFKLHRTLSHNEKDLRGHFFFMFVTTAKFLPKKFFFVITFAVWANFWLLAESLLMCVKTKTYLYRAKFLWKLNFKNMFFFTQFRTVSEKSRTISETLKHGFSKL